MFSAGLTVSCQAYFSVGLIISQSCGLDCPPLPGGRVSLSVLRHLQSSLYQELAGKLSFHNLESRRWRLAVVWPQVTSVWYSSSLVKFIQEEKTRIARQVIQEALSDRWYWGLEWWDEKKTRLTITITSSQPAVSPPPHRESSELIQSDISEWGPGGPASPGATSQQLTVRRPDGRPGRVAPVPTWCL